MEYKKIMYKIRRILLACLLIAALPMVTSCSDDDEDERGVGIEITWDKVKPVLPPDFIGGDDDDSVKVDVEKIKISVHADDNSLVGVYEVADTNELSKLRIELPEGEYRFFTTVNFFPPYIDEYNPTLSRAYTDGKVHFITLEEPNLSPEPAYCSENKVVITKKGVQKVDVKMREILADMTFVLKGVPNGTILVGSVESAAAGIFPRFDEAIGEMVAEPSDVIVPVKLPQILSTDGILNIKDFRLLPSAKGATETLIKIRLIYPNTKSSDFEIHAPVMNMGGKYHIALDFADMTPIMYLKSVKINDWTEGWTVNGEILNPED